MGIGVLRGVGVVLHTDRRELVFRRSVLRDVALSGEREAGRRRQPERRLPLAIDAGPHVEDGLVARRLIQLLDAEHHDEVGESGRDERVCVADAHRARGAHVLRPGAQRAGLDPESLGGHRRNMGLEGCPLRHDRAHHETLDVSRLHRRHGVEARLSGFPDQVAIARPPHAELRDAGPDQCDLPHTRLRMSTLVS